MQPCTSIHCAFQDSLKTRETRRTGWRETWKLSIKIKCGSKAATILRKFYYFAFPFYVSKQYARASLFFCIHCYVLSFTVSEGCRCNFANSSFRVILLSKSRNLLGPEHVCNFDQQLSGIRVINARCWSQQMMMTSLAGPIWDYPDRCASRVAYSIVRYAASGSCLFCEKPDSWGTRNRRRFVPFTFRSSSS